MEQPTKKEKGLTKRIEEKEIHQIGKRRSRDHRSQECPKKEMVKLVEGW